MKVRRLEVIWGERHSKAVPAKNSGFLRWQKKPHATRSLSASSPRAMRVRLLVLIPLKRLWIKAKMGK